jgi:hypothetical protein
MGHFLFFGWFAEVSEVDHILCYFFHSMDYVLIFPKRGLAKFWEIFFTIHLVALVVITQQIAAACVHVCTTLFS